MAHGGAKFWARAMAPVLASIMGLVALRALGPDVISQEQLSEWLRPLGQLAPVVFVLFLAVRPLTLLPGQVFAAVGGIMFGTLHATIYALIGSVLATALILGLSKKFGTRFMKRMSGSKYTAIRQTVKRHDFKFALLMCINPLMPTDVAIAAAGAAGARFWPTMAGVFVANIPGTYLTTQFGSALGQGETVMTVFSAVGMVLSLVLGIIFGRQFMRDLDKQSADEETRNANAAALSAEAHAQPNRAETHLSPYTAAAQ